MGDDCHWNHFILGNFASAKSLIEAPTSSTGEVQCCRWSGAAIDPYHRKLLYSASQVGLRVVPSEIRHLGISR